MAPKITKHTRLPGRPAGACQSEILSDYDPRESSHVPRFLQPDESLP
jgi:hypothetical protein